MCNGRIKEDARKLGAMNRPIDLAVHMLVTAIEAVQDVAPTVKDINPNDCPLNQYDDHAHSELARVVYGTDEWELTWDCPICHEVFDMTMNT